MNRNRVFTFFTIAVTVSMITSCGVKIHPNEKIIAGTWGPVKVEKVVDSAALQAAASLAGNATHNQQKSGSPAGEGGTTRKDAALERLVQTELRSTLEIFTNKTAIKNYPGKTMHATWKMKGNGTRIIAKNVEDKTKFVLDILEISMDQIVVVEHAPVGDVRITYERRGDAK